MKCRNCAHQLKYIFADLGHPPPSNAYIEAASIDTPEQTFPLQVYVCNQCWLVQTNDYVQADELFNASYAYFSSVSSGWLKHASEYAEMIIHRQKLDKDSLVIEIASNDGYLLKNFIQLNIPCLGIEPTADTAQAAESMGIPVLREFFTSDLAKRLADNKQQADLVIGNNVLAHVPNILDFVQGLKHVLKPQGIVTMEFPHLLQLIQNNQFDTIYHEHFSYLSLSVVNTIFKGAGLEIFDVEELTTHGGSLRIYARKTSELATVSMAVRKLLKMELDAGLNCLDTYLTFQSRIEEVKNDLLNFLREQKQNGRTVIAYGAAAKGNTLLNFSGIKSDLLVAVCDAAPSKQGKFMPGSHIPIYAPSFLKKNIPDYLLILPWNIADEIKEQNGSLKLAGTKFVTAIPNLLIS